MLTVKRVRYSAAKRAYALTTLTVIKNTLEKRASKAGPLPHGECPRRAGLGRAQIYFAAKIE